MFPETTRILIVDDMLTMRQLMKGQMRQMGFKAIYEADNGENGWAVLNAQKEIGEPIQLVLSDWNMPGMEGIDLLKKCRADEGFKSLPFMLITAEGEQKQVLEAIKSGVSNYLMKPFTRAALQEKLALVWKKHSEEA